MLKTFRFNPGFQTDKQAIENFIVRHNELDRILSQLQIAGGAHHHILVIAPRGAGKTTLCRRVLAEVRGSLFLQAAWLPVLLGEESYSVTTPGEFLLECLFHLADDPSYPDVASAHAEALQIDDEEVLQQHCLAAFRALRDQESKRLLLIVENLHMLLSDQLDEDGARRLIDLLADEAIFGVLATTVQADEEDERRDLLAAYMPVPLEPLSLVECHTLWEALTGQQVERARIRPLQILTGGSPRLMHILADFLNTPSLHDLMEDLTFLIDQNTEYFKSQLEALPSLERKVFVALLEAWDPASARDIADAARVTVNIASALLKRLTKRGAVAKLSGVGRAARYQATERLFNIYYLMRRRSHPSNRVRALVAFMTQYYDRDELVDTTALLAIEACKVEPGGRADYHNAFDAILQRQPEPIRSEILKRTPPDFLESLRKDPGLRSNRAEAERPMQDEADELLDRAHRLIAEDQLDEARDVLKHVIDVAPERYEPWISLAFLEAQADDIAAALDAARGAARTAPDVAFAHAVLGIMHGQADDMDAAVAAFDRALELDPELSVALIELAKIRHDADEDQLAIELFAKAAAIHPLSGEELNRYADLLVEHGEIERAEEMLRAGIAEDPEDEGALRALASLLKREERGEDAVGLLRDAALRSLAPRRWMDLATFQLYALSDPEAAIATIDSAFAKSVDMVGLYFVWVEALLMSGSDQDALESVIDRVEKDRGDSAKTKLIQAQLYERIDEPALAEAAYRVAAQDDDVSSSAWLLLGRLLSKRASRLDEAEEAFRKAVEVEGEDVACGPLKELAELRVHRGGDEEAGSLLDQALGVNEHCECSLILRAGVAERSGDLELARALFRKLLGLNPRNIPALTGLARLSREDAAVELIDRAVEIDDEDPRVLLARSRLFSRPVKDRLEDARDAIARDPSLTEARLECALLAARAGEKQLALEELGEALREIPVKMEVIRSFVRVTLDLVREGWLAEMEQLLTGEQGKPVEPLRVALQLYRGEHPIVAKEIEDVAQDILGQLQELDGRYVKNEPELPIT
ncbi:tetratricopeptide repeat protein [Sphingomonas sp. C8-2]|nr:tetratricopeptide repeat protein [Sphingomonas sp. C8-2]